MSASSSAESSDQSISIFFSPFSSIQILATVYLNNLLVRTLIYYTFNPSGEFFVRRSISFIRNVI